MQRGFSRQERGFADLVDAGTMIRIEPGETVAARQLTTSSAFLLMIPRIVSWTRNQFMN